MMLNQPAKAMTQRTLLLRPRPLQPNAFDPRIEPGPPHTHLGSAGADGSLYAKTRDITVIPCRPEGKHDFAMRQTSAGAQDALFGPVDLPVQPMRASVGCTMVTRSDIEDAATRLAAFVRQTPVIEVDGASLSLDYSVRLKLELLQHTGSFKARGAFNRLLNATIPNSGVITASGGNHGAAVAYAAQTLGVNAEIFVPAGTPETKVNRIRTYGAQVILGGAAYADALAASRVRQEETGALEVHAYDHADVLAGQGTVGREFEKAAPELTHVLVATGGGGLIGGIAAWYAGSAQIVSVEPENCPTLATALRVGHPVDCAVSGLAADSLGARQVGGLMFPIAQAFVSEAVLVTDEAIAAAQRLLWEQLRLIAEPGGATALAALLSGRFVPPEGARVGVVVCGGNTDPGKVAAG
jgi:threonine dehydratase